MNDFLGHGVYTFAEAARLTGVTPRRVRAWFEGWPTSTAGAVFTSDYSGTSRPTLISFLDLIDVLIVGQLRGANATWAGIRKAYKALSDELKSAHPFGRQEFYADTRGRLFKLIAHASGDKTLMEIATGQSAFPRLLLPFLKRIAYDPKSQFASRYDYDGGVVIDPRRRYGKPIVEANGMPTAILAQAYWGNDEDAEVVADWYGVLPGEVLTAVRFESKLRKAA